jgi:glycosyltransferase involved in cell wall biosynthesis
MSDKKTWNLNDWAKSISIPISTLMKTKPCLCGEFFEFKIEHNMQLIFILSIILIFYVYAGYPLVIFCISMLRHKPVSKDDAYLPSVTILIAAFNEEEVIEATLQNKLALDYPEDLVKIIVISDQSTDNTDTIVKNINSDRVTLLRQEPRAGKTSALNMAAPMVDSDIIVFSDANSIYGSDALRKIVRNFNDPEVGYVTGKMIYVGQDGSIIGDGCSAYMKYENILRKLETGVGSVVGVDGGIDAVRTHLYESMNHDQLPDFVQPLHVVKKGFRVVYEEEALLKEQSLKAASDEYKMRVRVSLRALWALSDMSQLLSLKNYNLFAFQLWSHKVLRYLCFIFLITAYLSNMAWAFSGNMKGIMLFILHNGFYFGAYMSPKLEEKGALSTLMYMLYYFVLLNTACAHACYKFILRQKQVLWTPRKG